MIFIMIISKKIPMIKLNYFTLIQINTVNEKIRLNEKLK